MNKSVPFFIGIIIASLVLLAGLAIIVQKLSNQSAQVSAPQSKSNPTEAPKRAFTNLSAAPSKEEVAVGESFTIAINVVTGENTITGVQLELSYDPTLLAVNAITQGDFFAKPIIYANKIDSTKGKITFAIGSFEGKKGVGTIARIQATALKPHAQSEVLRIQPTTLVTELESSGSVLNQSKGAILVIR